MRDFVLNNRAAMYDPAMQVQPAPAGMVPYAGGMAPQVPVGEPMIPYANPDEATGMDQKILNAVFGERAMKNLKAPKVTQEEAKREIAGMEDSVDMQMASPVPMQVMNKMQQKKDKDYQGIVTDYMKKREALAKNAEERARIVGDSFLGQVDLTPAMAFIDSMHGSKLAQSYKRPETYQQNLAAQQKFENQARQEYGALSDDEMNMLRQNLMGEQFEYKKKADAEDRALRREAIQAKRAQQGQKPLSEGMIKRLDYTIDGQDALARMQRAVEEGQTMRPDVPLMSDNEFTEALRDAAENYGRMQSGGAISKPEEERFVKTVWKFGDSRADVMRKINKQMNMFKGRQDRILSGGRSFSKPSSAPKAQPVGMPEVGMKSGGYEFIGGNPNDQASWRKL